MVILHAFLALLAGYATVALLVIVITALLTRTYAGMGRSEGRPKLGYAFFNLSYSFLAAAAGGYVTTCARSRKSAGQLSGAWPWWCLP